MRDVAEKAFLAVHVRVEVGSHLVDGFAELAEFVAPFGFDAGVEAALGDLFGGDRELAERARDAAHEREPEHHGQQQDSGAGEQPRVQIEKMQECPERIHPGHEQGGALAARHR